MMLRESVLEEHAAQATAECARKHDAANLEGVHVSMTRFLRADAQVSQQQRISPGTFVSHDAARQNKA
jgi:hypothetical protein